MPLNLANVNAVIVAQQFNPSVVNQLWLVSNGLMGPSDFAQGCIFSDVLAQVRSTEFGLLITPDQCQFAPKVKLEEQQDLALNKLGLLVRLLPHIPYRGLGLNFTWHARSSEEEIRTLTRSLFFVDGSRLHSFFTSPDARFGGYLSQDSLGFRMKLDAKPVMGITTEGENHHFLQFAFNFHMELGPSSGAPTIVESPVNQVELALKQWYAAYEQSREIAQVASGMEIE